MPDNVIVTLIKAFVLINVLMLFFGLMTVEARHAAWARNIVGTAPAPDSFDEPRSIRSVQAAVDRTRFIVRRPRTVARRRRPRFTG